jgi:transmembrane sensor
VTTHPENRPETEIYTHPDPVTDVALDWLLCLQAAPQDIDLRSRFEAWCRAMPSHAAAFDRVASTWDMPELAMATERLVQANATARLPQPVHRRPGRVVSISAAIAATVLIAAGINLYPGLMLRWQADYMTATGSKEQITLPDGSVMTLNTASAASLDFAAGRRSVKLLEGEAFFDVVPDAAHPFTVAGRFSEVKVKGTGFSVRTGPDEDLVVLEHGAIEVSRLPGRTETARLAPGEMIIATAGSLSAVRKTDTAGSLAWLQGRIVFDGQPLSQVIAEVGRYYPAPVVITSSAARKVVVSGNYRLTDPEGTIRSLATAAGATVTKVPGGILILR